MAIITITMQSMTQIFRSGNKQ